MSFYRYYLRKGEKHKASSKVLVDSALERLRFNPEIFAVFELWDKEAKPYIKGCSAVGLQGSKIRVRVPSVSHRQELLILKNSILERINQALRKKVLTDVQFELEGKKGGAGSGKLEKYRRNRDFRGVRE